MLDALRSLFLTVSVMDDATAPLKSIDQTGGEVARTMEQIDRTARATDETMQKFSKGAFVLGGSLAAIGAAGTLFFGQGAVDADKFDRAHSNLVKKVGANTDILIAEMKKASKGTIDEYDLMIDANTALTAGIDPTALPKMMEMALAASKSSGKDISETLSAINFAMINGREQMLNRLGITIQTDEAEKALANTLGKSVSALTDEQKLHAKRNAILAEGDKLIAKTDMDTASLTDEMLRSENAIGDVQREFSRGAIPILSAFAGVVEAVAKVLNYIPAPIKEIIGFLGFLGAGVLGAAGALLLFTGALAMANTQIMLAGGITNVLSGAMTLLKLATLSSLGPIYAFGVGLWAALAPLLPVIIPVALAIAALILLIQDLWTGFSGGDSIVLKALGNIWESIKSFFSGLWDVMKSVGKFLIDAFLMGMTGGMLNTDRLASIFDIIRQYLPFSDAKVGPLSDLTLSGQRFMETFAKGAELAVPGIGGALSGLTGALFGGGAPSSAAGVSVTVNITGNTISGDEGSLKTLAGMTASAVEDAVMNLLNRQAARAGI